MRTVGVLVLSGLMFLVSACVAHHTPRPTVNNKHIDLYLSTLDDKHFVWCKLDLAECRRDFEDWKQTPRGRMIIGEYQKEQIELTDNAQDLPHLFPTHFIHEREWALALTEELGQSDLETYGPPGMPE